MYLKKPQKCSEIHREISVGRRIQIADIECRSHYLKHVKLLSNVVLISYQTLIQLTDFKILNWIRTNPRIIRTKNLFTFQDQIPNYLIINSHERKRKKNSDLLLSIYSTHVNENGRDNANTLQKQT